MIILGIVIGIMIGICIGACLAQIGASKKDTNTKLSTSQVKKSIKTEVEKPIKTQNEKLKIEVLRVLEQRYATANEIASRLDITTQKAWALLRELYAEQKIQRLALNDKTLWGCIDENRIEILQNIIETT